ncbi:MAG: peptidylprolyl isomerase [Planctomycetes bacterium]|nr:peptidylprolyl isomerase [Planctomycetota bacterium]
MSCVLAAVLLAVRVSQCGEASTGQGAVVATVGGESVLRSDAERLLEGAVRGQEVDPAVLAVFQAQVLSEIIDRRLVLAYARRTGSAPSEAEIETALAQLRARIAARGGSPDAPLAEPSTDEGDLRRQVTWKLTWEKYLARYLTEERTVAYFRKHRREFDGTEVFVSHVLLRFASGDGPKAIDALVDRARSIREEIVSGELSFDEAARQHSGAPSAAAGGQLGFIGRRGPMVESFSRAAFALEPDQVSEPVTTRFGVHLIRCDQVKPGSRSLDDAREELEAALARELLQKLARLQEPHTPVEFTGAWPHFKAGARELVVP